MYKAAIITLSDRAFQGIYDDKSGEFLKSYLTDNNFEVVSYVVIDDDRIKLEDELAKIGNKVDLIITTGGTGLTTSDITIDVVEKIIDYEIRGMSIALHNLNLSKSPGAMFSRALCGVIGRTMLITLPGSLKAVTEIMEYFTPHLNHGLDHLNNKSIH